MFMIRLTKLLIALKIVSIETVPVISLSLDHSMQIPLRDCPRLKRFVVVSANITQIPV